MNRRLKSGLFIAISSVVVVAIAVVVNLLCGAFPEEYTHYDISGMGLYELTDQTESMIENVDEEITLYLVARDGAENTTILEFLKRYERLNSKISIEIVDPEVIPTFATENGTTHTISNLTENSVIVSGENRDYEVLYSAIFTTEYSEEEMMMYYYYGQTPTGTTTFNAEQAITSAIDNITSENLPKLYILTGHNEYAIGSALTSYLKTDNYETQELSLMTGDGSIPEDADCIIINSPAADLTEAELETLKGYIDEGGKVILVTSYNTEGVDFTNLYELGEYYGMSVVEGLVMESNTANYSQAPYYIVPNLSATDSITSGLSGSYTIFPTAHAISISDELDENVTVSKLAFTSSDAYTAGIQGTQINAEDVLYSGECVIAAKATVNDTNGRFVWFTSYGVTDDGADQAVSGGNSKLFLATLGDLCEKKESVSIAGKVMNTEYLVTTASSPLVFGAVFVIIIPVAFIITGIVVSVVRRRR